MPGAELRYTEDILICGPMFTPEATNAQLIFRVGRDIIVKRVLYQGQIHLIQFRHLSEQLRQAFESLQFHDFARSQSCHMTEGIFGVEKHTAEMETAKTRVWGFLLGTATSGHKFLRCVQNARKRERSRDWRILRDDLKHLPDLFRRTRNFLEHLDEKTDAGTVKDMADCRFSRHGVLQFRDSSGPVEFDFTVEGLAPVEKIWSTTIAMLKARPAVLGGFPSTNGGPGPLDDMESDRGTENATILE